ncbi:unnamed protein product [marine sediment metagenome]|uniref:Uncharacterized protein n=1 Tax=marine sediment metagenome TaxID=412755 RepID=X0VDK9_9ZZZZ
MICENWSVPDDVDKEIIDLGKDQRTNADKLNIEHILKVKSADSLLIYNQGDEKVAGLYIYVLDAEYGEIVKKGEIIKKLDGEIFRESLGELLVGEDIIVRVWRCCLAEKEDSERGVTILRDGGKGQSLKISFLTPPVVDFDNWVKKLVEK